jgi:protein-tyrosine phosphatase
VNVSTHEYTKRSKYFKYLNIDVFDRNDEDIKKHFRITNRFIANAIKDGGRVLVHDF